MSWIVRYASRDGMASTVESRAYRWRWSARLLTPRSYWSGWTGPMRRSVERAG